MTVPRDLGPSIDMIAIMGISQKQSGLDCSGPDSLTAQVYIQPCGHRGFGPALLWLLCMDVQNIKRVGEFVSHFHTPFPAGLKFAI
jgi:hypothetical protein